MKYQQAHHSVLHMMGESSRLRIAVFQRGWDSICLSPQSIPDQLNLSQPILKALALQIFYDRIDEIINTFNCTNNGSDIILQNFENIFNDISEGREIILQINILKNNNDNKDNKVKNVLSSMYTTVQHTYRKLLEFRNHMPIDTFKHVEIKFLNLCSIIGEGITNT
jgi:hypothetical protein